MCYWSGSHLEHVAPEGQVLSLAPVMTAERHQGGDPFLRQLPGDRPRRHSSAGRGQVAIISSVTCSSFLCHCMCADFASASGDQTGLLRSIDARPVDMGMQVQGGEPRPDHRGHLRTPQAERGAVRGDAGGRRRRRAGGSRFPRLRISSRRCAQLQPASRRWLQDLYS